MTSKDILLKMLKRSYINLTVLTLKDIYIYLQLLKYTYSTFNSLTVVRGE
ncbi:MAG: hypothetical protein IPG53_05070 [Ignavibacteriales bacterium]|nr:hypothetical protein [Ignavibacteriales bacterium]